MRKAFDNPLIHQALKRLAELGRESDLEIELNIYGGSAMILAYDLGKRTKDVDAIFRPREEVLRLALQVAEELDLEESWLNDDVRFFAAPIEAKRKLPLDLEGLRIQVPTAAYLLAMKARAARRPLPGYEGDYGDLRFLIKKLEIKSLDELQERIDRFFPDDVISSEKAEFIAEIIEEVWENE